MRATTDLDVVFERAPGLADRVRAALPADARPDDVVALARRILAGMSERERVAVLDAHPRIGAAPTTLSTLSLDEQGHANVATRRELAALNDEYERTFGFRFVVWVNGRAQAEIVPLLEERLRHTREQELARGIEEFLAITRDRLEKVR